MKKIKVIDAKNRIRYVIIPRLMILKECSSNKSQLSILQQLGRKFNRYKKKPLPTTIRLLYFILKTP